MSSRSAACWTAIEPAGGAEVDQREPTVGQQHDVSRMRVGVEHAVLEHLLEKRLEQQVGELRAFGERARRPTRRRARSTPSSHSITSTRDVLRSS